jgi:hypothetical protein
MVAGSWYRKPVVVSKYFRPPCNVLVVPRVAAPPPGDKTIALSFLRKEFLMSSAFQLSARSQARYLPQAGPHPACFVALIGLGTHTTTQEHAEDGNGRTAYQFAFGWELVDDDKRPILLQKYNRATGDRSHLYRFLMSWQVTREPSTFNLTNLLGRHALVVVSHEISKSSGRPFAKVGFPTPLMPGMVPVPPRFEPITWEVGSGTPPPAALDSLPWLLGERLMDWINRSPEEIAFCRARASRSTKSAPAGDSTPANGTDATGETWVAGEDDGEPAF